jgi:thymidylate synthase (FAD)
MMMKQYGRIAEDWLVKKKGDWPSHAEMLIEVAGRACYRSFGTGLNPNVTRTRSESKEYFENVLKRGDGSILEHATVTFALMWVSRVLTHQLVRHRAGTAFSQESLRYVRIQDLQIPDAINWLPPELSEDIKGKLMKALEGIENQYHQIQAAVSWEKMSFDQKKRVTSAIRRVLPEALATVIIFTANHRTLRWLIEMRTDPSAELEIRTIFGKIADLCLKDYPLIYGDFERIATEDGVPQYKPRLRSKV